MISSLIGSINSILGISLGNGIKINATDIVLVVFFIYEFIIKKRKLYIIEPIKLIILMILLMSSQMFLGILNGAQIGTMVRVLRNGIYILLMFILTYSHYKNNKIVNIQRDLLIFSWIAIINCFFNILVNYKKYSWFIYYRENSSFQVFMFVFLLLYKNPKKERLSMILVRILTIVCLGLCIFFSQERLQIIAVIVSLSLKIIYSIGDVLTKNEIKINISRKSIPYKLIIIIIVSVLVTNIMKIEYINDYIDYFMKYRLGAIFNGSKFQMDASLDGRAFQLHNILNRHWIFYLFGSGLSSIYTSAAGPTYIVDSMWLWVFKDLGIVGILLLFTIYLFIYIEISKMDYNKLSVRFGLVAILVLQIFTPNIMLGISDSVFIGYIIAMIGISKKINKYKSTQNKTL